MNLYSISNFKNLWGDNYIFHHSLKNEKHFLVIVEKNYSVSDGTAFYLDFCTHNSFEEANETLYRLCFSNDVDNDLDFLLLHSGRGGSSSFDFYCEVISHYLSVVSIENKKRSSINLFVCNEKGMSKIIDYCNSLGFFFIGSCLTFRPTNYIPIINRKIS